MLAYLICCIYRGTRSCHSTLRFAGALFRRVSVYTGLFLLLRVGQHLYVRRLPAARSAEIVTVVFGNEDDKDDSFADSGLDLLPCCTR